MVKISRISLGGIESLTDSQFNIVGECTIQASGWSQFRIKTPNKTCEVSDEIQEFLNISNNTFLRYIDRYLMEKRLFLTDAIYRPEGKFKTHKLSGILYKEEITEE